MQLVFILLRSIRQPIRGLLHDSGAKSRVVDNGCACRQGLVQNLHGPRPRRDASLYFNDTSSMEFQDSIWPDLRQCAYLRDPKEELLINNGYFVILRSLYHIRR